MAVKFALKVFGKRNPEIMLINAVSSHQAGAVMTLSLSEELMHESEERMKELRDMLLKEHPGINLQTVVKAGPLAAVLVNFAEEYKPDLVVMGTNGVTGLYERMVGSNTREVMNVLTFPLIVVPVDCMVEKLDTMLLALDMQHDDERIVQRCANLCRKLDWALHIVHFIDENEEVKNYDFDTEMFKGVKFSLDQVKSTSGDIEANILKFAKRDAVDLIAIVPHHKTFLKSLFHRSTSENLLQITDIPVLIA